MCMLARPCTGNHLWSTRKVPFLRDARTGAIDHHRDMVIDAKVSISNLLHRSPYMTAEETFSLRSCHSYLKTRHRCFKDSFRCNLAGEPGAESPKPLLLAPAPAPAALLA